MSSEPSLKGKATSPKRTVWQQWLERPEKSSVRQVFFQVHLWFGAAASAYILFMSVSGSAIVFRNELSGNSVVEWLVRLHENLLTGSVGHVVNGIGGICLTLLCLTGAAIWWPGIKHWRRSLTVDWSASFARINWDLHSALGFWCLAFVTIWGVSAIYFVFPQAFNIFLVLDPGDRFTDQGLSWLSELHFGRFGRFAEALWMSLGLVPAVLAFTGVFICCRRVIYKKPSNPRSQLD
jgi:uncharacterized iron-regulated membrane protein